MGILLSLDGKLVCEAYEGYPMDYPQPLWAEQPVERWVNALRLTVRKLLSASGVTAEHVRALSVATQVYPRQPTSWRSISTVSNVPIDWPVGRRTSP